MPSPLAARLRYQSARSPKAIGIRSRRARASRRPVSRTGDPTGGRDRAIAALIVATLKGTFILPPEARAPKDVDRQLRALEQLIG